MNAHQIRTKSTDRATRKKIGRESVVRPCCGRTLKRMVLGFECGLIGSTCRANEIQYRNCVDLDLTQSLNQASGRSIDFHHALNEFYPVCSPTMKVTIRANHCSNIFGVSNNLHFTEFFTIFRDPGNQRLVLFVAILNPTAFAIIQIEASNVIHGTECRCQCRHQLS